jgi:hypothetical protein
METDGGQELSLTIGPLEEQAKKDLAYS